MKNILYNKNLLLTFLLIIGSLTVYSTDYTSLSAGDWATNSTWSPSGKPGAGDNVEIKHAVTFAGNQSCNNLTLSAGFGTGAYTLTVLGDIGNTATVSVTGTVIVRGTGIDIGTTGKGTITFSSLELNYTGTRVLRVNVDVSTLLTITDGVLNAQTFNVSGSGGLTATGGILQLRKLGTTLPSLLGTYNITGGAINLCGVGDQIIRSKTYSTLYLSEGGTKTCAGAIDVNGDLSIRTGTTLNPNGYDISVAGNFTIDPGGAYTASANTVTFDGGSTQTFSSPNASQTLNHVVIAGTAVNIGGSITSLTVNNLAVNTGSFTAPATLTVNGNTTLNSGGTFTAGANIYAKGNWTNNGGTFTPGSNTVTFNGTASQTINGSATSQTFYNVFANLSAGRTLSTGGFTTTLTVQGLTITTGNFTAPATLTVNGLFTLNSGTFTAGANFYSAGDSYVYGGTFLTGTGTITYIGTSSQTVYTPVASITLYNVTLNLTAGKSLLLIAPNNSFTTQDFTQISGNFIAPPTFTINGNATLTGGTLTAGTNITAKGNWTNNGGTFTPGTNTVTFNGTGTKYINGSNASQTFYNVVLNGDSVITGGGTSSITGLTVNDLTQTKGSFVAPATLNINGNYILTSGIFTAGANIFAKGNWTKNGGTFTPGTGINTVTFNGTGAQTINGSATSQTFNNVVVAGTTVLTASGSTTQLTTNNLTLTSGSFTAPATLYINGNTLLNGGTFTAGTNIYTLGNWMSNGGSFDVGSSTTTFNSNAVQTIGGTNNNLFYDLILNNTFAASPPDAPMNMSTDVTVKNTLTMTTGNVNLWNNTITIGTSDISPGTVSRSGGWMFNGKFKRYVNSASFSIGDAAGYFPTGSAQDYRPFWISHADALATGGSITASHTATYPAAHTEVNFIDASWGTGTTVKFLSASYWTISLSGITGGASSFSIRAEGTGLGPIADVNHLTLSGSSGTIGTYAASAGSTSNPQVTRTGLSFSDFSFTNLTTRADHEFYIASSNSLSPLPIRLLKFDAVLQDKQTVNVSWITASETNNDYFTVEKSADGVNFEKIVSVKGAGSYSRMLTYNSTDYFPFAGQSYYRLKQTDFDGKFTYSNIVPINTGAQSTLTVYPNPAADNDVIQISVPTELKGKTVLIQLYDLQGRKVYSNKVFIESGRENMTIIDRKLNADKYVVSITCGSNVYKQILIVK